jgi:hypothetical protein
MRPTAEVYLDTAAVAERLIASPEVAARWDEPSALAEMTVGALAGHLARQIVLVPAQLAGAKPGLPDAEMVSLLGHYMRVPWVGAGLDDEANVSIRRDGAGLAAGGAAGLAGRTAAAIAELRTVLPAMDGDSPYYLPWTGWSLRLEDFLTTRLLEIVIHVDDLAVSVGAPPPALPGQALDTVLVLVTRLAAWRHGPIAVLRALTRAERAPATIAAF